MYTADQVYSDMLYLVLHFSVVNGYDHITYNAPDPIRTPKLTCVEPAQYWGGGPPGNSVVLYPFFFFLFLTYLYMYVSWRCMHVYVCILYSYTYIINLKPDSKPASKPATHSCNDNIIPCIWHTRHNSLVVEHPLCKRKAGGSIPPCG